MVLATPGLADIFEKENEFIPNFLKRAFGERNDYKVDVLGAIVDQISLPAQWAAAEASVAHRYHAGMEGVSFMVTTHRAARLNFWGSTSDSKDVGAEKSVERLRDLGPNANRAGLRTPHGAEAAKDSAAALSVVMSPSDDSQEKLGDEYISPLMRYIVKLPLTQTTFLNGRMYTLVAQAWEIENTTTGVTEATLVRERDMTNATIHISLDEHPAVPFRPNFQKWRPLTPPRKIAKSAGNVIRTFKSSKGLMGEMPASEELEAAVQTRIFPGRTRKETEVYEIWAQVTPRERRLDLPRGVINVEDSLALGDRFYKVLSGGGGWGSKRGLIALDDEAAFEDDPELDIESSVDFEDSSSTIPENPFPALVRPGDVVRFIGAWFSEARPMTIRRAKALSSRTQANAVPRWFHVRGGTSLRFGATSPLSSSNENSSETDPLTHTNDASLFPSPDSKATSLNTSSASSSSSTNSANADSDALSFLRDSRTDSSTNTPFSDSSTKSSSNSSPRTLLPSLSTIPEEPLYPNYTQNLAHLACYGHFGALSDHGASLSLDAFTPPKPLQDSPSTSPPTSDLPSTSSSQDYPQPSVPNRTPARRSRSVLAGAERLGNIVRTKIPPWSSVSYCEKPFVELAPYARRGYFQAGDERAGRAKYTPTGSIGGRKTNGTDEERSELEEIEAFERELEKEMRMEREVGRVERGVNINGGGSSVGNGDVGKWGKVEQEEEVGEGWDMWNVLKQTHEKEERRREWETEGYSRRSGGRGSHGN